ncbi:GNAT family N-acetyltransferase [Psychroserpens sp.]|uniref:GNAT family N-acetyltransferase n=1 Tax=Psychroserpens sp. TaxID=2020870 RepID=UPI001B287B2E|nr:GNAT family N-acetyltransferase [Psychroserpens sp.]MBO6605343.1 GNAT family N-acetyltransferase [Psychroserpens sp.]MBO6629974.1 GNAT family N-acetyltransferase [Psychroserpens sp.]MBO6653848.1 GNAT family N-acetyltransferase [Psychroserpens sp.]MBO6682169.1 GNAT family N-acetyltransferase [Psychroserpens sp.]MBO6748717.1 GNAT family N-acetyltransferase [Psychroserpens sp.]
MLKTIVKSFDQLNTTELYDLLQLRSEVFVVEQDCVYQDIDGKDKKALHVLGYNGTRLVAYTRLFSPGDYFEEASIGRVVVSENDRKFRFGYYIMNASIEAVKSYYKTSEIKISAQTYLKRFYNNLQFFEVGEEYLEDGIPHIAMLYKNE